MINFLTVIKRCLPPGSLWGIPIGDTRNLFEALAEELETVRAFLDGTRVDSNPGTCVDTLEEWHEQYDIPYVDTTPLAIKQATVLQRFTSLGGQDIEYFQANVEAAGFYDIVIGETTAATIFEFTVVGSVSSVAEFTRLKALVQRLSPAHCHPAYTVVTEENAWGVAVVGTGYCSAT